MEQTVDSLAKRVIDDATAVLGVHEDGDSNSGVYVDQYLKFVGLTAGNPWCCAFAVFRVHKAAGELGLSSRLPKTGSSSALCRWYREQGLLLAAPTPGCIGMVRGGPTGHCHTFIVVDVRDGDVLGIDGNEGNRVERSRRPIGACDYGPIC